jgi:ribose/xylose/arabinose/galactoside ABC-type transport system permease subunit
MSSTAATPPLGAARTSPLRQPVTATIVGLGLVAVIGVLWFLFSTDGFATWGNLKAVLAASSFVGIIAAGQTVIMVSGNFFSMSLGVQAAGSAMFFLWALKFGLVPAIALTIVCSILISGAQGFTVGSWGASSIIITIASSVAITGVVILISGGATIKPPPSGPSIDFLGTQVGGISISVFVMLGVALLVQFFLSRTSLGALSFLIGSNRVAARAAGIPVTLAIVVVFGIAGACAAVCGIMMSGFQQTASLSLQGTLMFDAIAAVLVGGVAVLGGRGSAIAAVLGTIGISAINSALVLHGYSTGIQVLVKGGLVMTVVVAVHLWQSERR